MDCPTWEDDEWQSLVPRIILASAQDWLRSHARDPEWRLGFKLVRSHVVTPLGWLPVSRRMEEHRVITSGFGLYRTGSTAHVAMSPGHRFRLELVRHLISIPFDHRMRFDVVEEMHPSFVLKPRPILLVSGSSVHGTAIESVHWVPAGLGLPIVIQDGHLLMRAAIRNDSFFICQQLECAIG